MLCVCLGVLHFLFPNLVVADDMITVLSFVIQTFELTRWRSVPICGEIFLMNIFD